MQSKHTFAYGAIMAGLLAATGNTAADTVQELQQRLAQMEKEMQALRAELGKLANAEPAQQQKVQEIETRVAKVEQTTPAVSAPLVKGHRVFFRGGYAGLVDSRANGAFTDMLNVPAALAGIGVLPAGTSIQNSDKDGWYFGAGFDFLLSKDTLGLLPGVWTLAELGVEFRNLGSKDAHLLGPVAECLIVNNALTAGTAGVVPGIQNCANIKGNQELLMLTVSASPKLKFMEGSKLRPWLIPAGFDVNVISPPSDTTNYLDVGVEFAGGVDYEFMPGLTLGADIRYHLAANMTDPDYSASAVAAARATGLTLNTNPNNDTWTAGLSLGVSF